MLPESCSRLRPLYRGGLFAIDDWRCAGHDTPRRSEEWCRDDRIVVTRRGAWELEIAGSAHLADPMHVIFWNRGAHYRVRHPVPGGDDFVRSFVSRPLASMRFAIGRGRGMRPIQARRS